MRELRRGSVVKHAVDDRRAVLIDQPHRPAHAVEGVGVGRPGVDVPPGFVDG